jgi:hypothetical protein
MVEISRHFLLFYSLSGRNAQITTLMLLCILLLDVPAEKSKFPTSMQLMSFGGLPPFQFVVLDKPTILKIIKISNTSTRGRKAKIRAFPLSHGRLHQLRQAWPDICER